MASDKQPVAILLQPVKGDLFVSSPVEQICDVFLRQDDVTTKTKDVCLAILEQNRSSLPRGMYINGYLGKYERGSRKRINQGISHTGLIARGLR